ncbi:hypothetical protein DIPPA_18781 [Diplonema papillatum]|nr:hypothetical protein DIPPA_18781 [Diplonema papillatum]
MRDDLHASCKEREQALEQEVLAEKKEARVTEDRWHKEVLMLEEEEKKLQRRLEDLEKAAGGDATAAIRDLRTQVEDAESYADDVERELRALKTKMKDIESASLPETDQCAALRTELIEVRNQLEEATGALAIEKKKATLFASSGAAVHQDPPTDNQVSGKPPLPCGPAQGMPPLHRLPPSTPTGQRNRRLSVASLGRDSLLVPLSGSGKYNISLEEQNVRLMELLDEANADNRRLQQAMTRLNDEFAVLSSEQALDPSTPKMNPATDDSLTNRIHELEVMLAATKEDNDATTQKSLAVTSELETVRLALAESVEQIQVLKSKPPPTDDTVHHELQVQVQKLQQEATAGEAVRKSLKGRVENLQKELKAVVTEGDKALEVLQNEVQSMKAKLANVNKTNEDLEDKVIALEQQHSESAGEELVRYKHLFETANDELSSAKAEKERALEERMEAEDELINTKQELEQLRLELGVRESRSAVDERIAQLEVDNAAMQHALSLHQQIGETQKQTETKLESIQQELAESNQKLEASAVDLAKLQALLDEAEAQKEAAAGKYEAEVNILKDSIKAAEALLTDQKITEELGEKAAANKEEIAKLEEKAAANKEEIAKLKSDLKKASKEVKDAKKAQKDAGTRLANEKKKVERAATREKKTKELLEAAETERGSWKEAAESLDAERGSLLKKVEELTSAVATTMDSTENQPTAGNTADYVSSEVHKAATDEADRYKKKYEHMKSIAEGLKKAEKKEKMAVEKLEKQAKAAAARAGKYEKKCVQLLQKAEGAVGDSDAKDATLWQRKYHDFVARVEELQEENEAGYAQKDQQIAELQAALQQEKEKRRRVFSAVENIRHSHANGALPLASKDIDRSLPLSVAAIGCRALSTMPVATNMPEYLRKPKTRNTLVFAKRRITDCSSSSSPFTDGVPTPSLDDTPVKRRKLGASSRMPFIQEDDANDKSAALAPVRQAEPSVARSVLVRGPKASSRKTATFAEEFSVVGDSPTPEKKQRPVSKLALRI